MNTVCNYQVLPARQRIVPNDVINKKLFSLTLEAYEKLMVRSARGTVLEKKTKRGAVTSYFDLTTPLLSEPLNQFDAAVLSACVSEWDCGNRCTTPAIIYRSLTGQVGKEKAVPSANMNEAIMASVKKLMRLQGEFDLHELSEKLKYGKALADKITGQVLPARVVEGVINGAQATIITFLGESPLLTVASLKNNQLVTYDAALLDVPGLSNTPQVISVKNYVMRRVIEIKLHKNLARVITFEDVFAKCQIDAQKAKERVRGLVIMMFENLKKCQQITYYEVMKRGSRMYGVHFE